MFLKDLLLNLFFPKKCFGCEIAGRWLCKKCLAKITPYDGEAPRALTNLSDLIIAGDYRDKILKELIIAFKFGFNQELALPLFIYLKITLDKKIIIDNLSGKIWNDVLVIPIPLHKKRLRWRGFNQSELLSREISNYYGWPLNLSLIKIRYPKNQVELKEDERLKNIFGVFKWQGAELTNKTILLVDDVITSGATMNEAEKVLIEAGAKRVIKIALAKG